MLLRKKIILKYYVTECLGKTKMAKFDHIGQKFDNPNEWGWFETCGQEILAMMDCLCLNFNTRPK